MIHSWSDPLAAVPHKSDATIRGHVVCSLLALVLLSELEQRMADRGWKPEWERLKSDLDRLQEIWVEAGQDAFFLRTRLEGNAGKAFQAAGIALGPTVRHLANGIPARSPSCGDRAGIPLAQG